MLAMSRYLTKLPVHINIYFYTGILIKLMFDSLKESKQQTNKEALICTPNLHFPEF